MFQIAIFRKTEQDWEFVHLDYQIALNLKIKLVSECRLNSILEWAQFYICLVPDWKSVWG